MLVILSLLFSLSANAAEYKRLVNCNGVQQLLSHDGTGETACRVLWDEKAHGPMPSLPGPVGTLEEFLDAKGDRGLRVNSDLKAAYDAQVAADAVAKKNEDDEVSAVKLLKEKLDADTSLTAAELRRALRFILKKSMSK